MKSLERQTAYKLGRFISITFTGVIMYGIYGYFYWVVNRSLYFGPWEWGLCFVTAVYVGIIQRIRKD